MVDDLVAVELEHRHGDSDRRRRVVERGHPLLVGKGAWAEGEDVGGESAREGELRAGFEGGVLLVETGGFWGGVEDGADEATLGLGLDWLGWGFMRAVVRELGWAE